MRWTSGAATAPRAMRRRQRRPDMANAEAKLAAASANLQAAGAALWPRLTLTGSAGTSAGRASDWLREPVYSLLAGLAGPIFDGGRLAAERDGAQARREELLAGKEGGSRGS